jgi:hypothetical protein
VEGPKNNVKGKYDPGGNKSKHKVERNENKYGNK